MKRAALFPAASAAFPVNARNATFNTAAGTLSAAVSSLYRFSGIYSSFVMAFTDKSIISGILQTVKAFLHFRHFAQGQRG